MIRHGLPRLLPGLAAALAGCASELSPVQPVLEPAIIKISDSVPQELRIEAPGDAPVRITLSARDVDIKAAVVRTNRSTVLYADAPNRRMGIETLLVEPPHERVMTLRIERNDHREARGAVNVTAVVLPTVTPDDRRRLEAARLEAAACLQFPDPARGLASAEAFVAAAELHDETGDQPASGTALLHAAGAQYTRNADWKGAAASATRALRRLEGTGNPLLAAYAMRVSGAALSQLAEALGPGTTPGGRAVSRARKQLTDAAHRFETQGSVYEAAYALNYRGVSFLESGERDQAQADFRQALELFRSSGDRPAQALSLQSLALLSYEDGRLADAMRAFDEALALIPRDEDPGNYAHTLNNSALPLRVLGRFDEAIARYFEAGQMLRALGDRDGEARALHGLGTALKYVGEPERARDFLRAAVQLRSESGASRERAITLIVLGQIERDAGNPAAALALHREAAGLVDASHDLARAHLAVAQDYLAAGDLSKARQELEIVLRLDLPATHRHLGMALTELAVIESREGNPSAAHDAFARAIAVHTANGSEFELARAMYRRAEAGMRTGDLRSVLADTTAALKLFDAIGLQGTQSEGRASFRATYRGVTELQISALVTAAAGARAQGDPARAQQLLRAALIASDRARVRMLIEADASVSGSDDAAHPPVARRRQIYELIAGKRHRREQLLDTASPDARELAALGKDIALLRAEARLIEARMAKAGKSADHAAPAAADEPFLAIGDDVRVIEYFLGRSASWIFSVQNGDTSVYPLPGAGELEAVVREIHGSWRAPASTRGDRYALSRQMAGMLLGALEGPAPAGMLWIVPDGALHLVPMALLAHQFWPDMRPGSIFVVPSLTAVAGADRRRGAPPAKSLAMIADPVYATNDSRLRDGGGKAAPAHTARSARDLRNPDGLQRIPSTGAEARAIIAIVGPAEDTLALTGLDASRPRVFAAPLDRYRIVHFATHAVADDEDAALASLALSRWNARGEPIDGDLRLYDITQLRLNAELVVLSGCETALGKEIAGEGPIGLSQAFLRSGARSVVASLWRVPDSSTAVLMREFYRQLLTNGQNPAAALQLAQDAVRQQARWSDPYYWAGFQLVSVVPHGRGNNVVNTHRE